MGSQTSSSIFRTPPPGRTSCNPAYSTHDRRPRSPLLREGVQMTTAHVEVIEGAKGVCRNWDVTLLCWQCSASLAELTPDTRTGSGIRTCQLCKMTTQYRDGIWRALSPGRSRISPGGIATSGRYERALSMRCSDLSSRPLRGALDVLFAFSTWVQ